MKNYIKTLLMCAIVLPICSMNINLDEFPSDDSAVSAVLESASSFAESDDDLSDNSDIEYESGIESIEEFSSSVSDSSEGQQSIVPRRATRSTVRVRAAKRTHDEIEEVESEDNHQKRITDFFRPGQTDLFAAYDAALAQQSARAQIEPPAKKHKVAKDVSVPYMLPQNIVEKIATIVGYTRGRWKLPEQDDNLIRHVMAQYKVSYPVAQTVVNRGYVTDDQIDNYFNVSYEKDVPHSSLLKNANKAVARLKLAITRKEKILICGDYDVDGMTSSALLITCLRPLGAHIDYHIPHRVRDGYGLKTETIEWAAQEGYTVVITVDNGITSFDPAIKAKELKIDLIITDHHLAHDGVPGAYTVVNPNQPDCTYPHKSLAGIGVAFKLMCLLYEQKKIELPNKAYELMMLGTIADVVPLTGENRYWVRRGLTLVNNGLGSDSYKKLVQNSQKQGRVSSIDVAFGLTPQLNALGRLDDANKGVKFLLGDAINDIESIGTELLTFNIARKKIQLDMTRKAVACIRSKKGIDLNNDTVIILADPSYHPGVNGLVASKIAERFFKPTIIATQTRAEDGSIILKGSARSCYNINLFECLKQCKDLLLAFGGHKVAAGLAFKKENLELLKQRLNSVCLQEKRETQPYQGFPIDAQASFKDVKKELFKDLEKLEPFGSENPQPTFLFNNVQVATMPQWLGQTGQHVKCTLKDSSGERRDVKFFFRGDMHKKLRELRQDRSTFKLIGHPDENHWNGKVSMEINGVDIESLEKSTYH